jgi:hypothetical protein
MIATPLPTPLLFASVNQNFQFVHYSIPGGQSQVAGQRAIRSYCRLSAMT